MFETSQAGFLWMESFTNFEKAPDLTKRGYRLDRMKLLLQCFQNPQDSYKVIHIAGSKGKGSTAAFTASILKEISLYTGVYSSPHISDYRERITIDGEYAQEHIYIKNMILIKELIEGDKYLSLPGGSEPTTFELLTLLAFITFRDMKCKWVVLETGLGGRLDATNLVIPEISILTQIELEHTDLLGETLREIASEKAGIIKNKKPVISSDQNNEALEVFENRCRETKSKFYYLPHMMNQIKTRTSLIGTQIEVHWNSGGVNKSVLKLHGQFQGENCALAIGAIKLIMPSINDETINRAIAKTTLPGRMEIIESSSQYMLDGAHTKKSTEKLFDAYKSIFDKKGILIFGSVSGKDADSMAEVLADKFEHIIISTPGSFKRSDPNAVYQLFKKRNFNTTLILDPLSAKRKADEISKGKLPILVTGSFYMAAELRNILLKKEAQNDR